MLVVLHSVLPHEHNTIVKADLSIGAVSDSFDLWSMLKSVFHQDLGEDHLENIQISSADQILHVDFQVVTVLPVCISNSLLSVYSISEYSTSIYFQYKDPPFKEHHYTNTVLRGPPLIS